MLKKYLCMVVVGTCVHAFVWVLIHGEPSRSWTAISCNSLGKLWAQKQVYARSYGPNGPKIPPNEDRLMIKFFAGSIHGSKIEKKDEEEKKIEFLKSYVMRADKKACSNRPTIQTDSLVSQKFFSQITLFNELCWPKTREVQPLRMVDKSFRGTFIFLPFLNETFWWQI